ncbi:hypothetical protein [Microbacterium aurum]
MFTSPFPDVEIPELSIYDDLFGDLSAEDSARVALIGPATGAETTYGALKAQIDAFAGALAARGVTTDTVLGVLCPSCRRRRPRRMPSASPPNDSSCWTAPPLQKRAATRTCASC